MNRLRILSLGLGFAWTATTAGQNPGNSPKSEAIERARYYLDKGQLLEGGKVIGGRRAKAGDDPWQVGLILPLSTTNGAVRLFCGGSLVGSGWIMTAAHCVDGSTDTSDFAVISGGVDLYASRVPVKPDRILIHPGWRPAPYRWNDVALVHLSSATPPASSIALTPGTSSSSTIASGLQGRVTGWGAVGETGGSVQYLRWVTVAIVSKSDCDDAVSHRGRLTDGMFCAGYGVGGRDSCQGDSGGPLSVASGTSRHLVGIVSWGDGCGKPAKFGVYTKVAAYADWAKTCMAGSSICDWLSRRQ